MFLSSTLCCGQEKLVWWIDKHTHFGGWYMVGYNKLVAIIMQNYRDSGKAISMSEARKLADKVGKKVDLNNDDQILIAAKKA